MTFDNLEQSVPDDVASARGDLFEATDTLDPFNTVDAQVNGSEEDEEGEVEEAPEQKADEKPQDAAEPEQEQDATQSGKVDNIPYPRFKSEVDKAKALKTELEASQARIRELEEAQQRQSTADQQAPKTDPTPPAEGTTTIKDIEAKIKDVSRAYSEAVIDGDVDKAAELQAEIVTLQSDLSVEKAEAKALEREYTRQAQANQAAVQNTVDAIVSRHEEHFNDQLNLEQFRVTRDWYMRQEGMSMQDALLAAEQRIFGTASGKSEGDDMADLRSQVVARQRERAVQRGVDTASSQPPSMSAANAVGNRSASTQKGGMNGLTMSQKQFDDMPRKEMSIRRGDIVAG